MKKIISVLLTIVLVFVMSASMADEKKKDEELLDEYVEEMEETDSSFTVPVGVGIIYSVIIYRDGVSVVFSPLKSKKAALGLKALDFITDVNEIKLYYKNGQSAVLPATVEIKSYDVGTFITLNMSSKTMTAISDLSSIKSELDKVAFVHGDKSEQEMSVEELNQALSGVFGGAIDIANQSITAITTFWNNLSGGIGVLAANTYSSVEKALVSAGDWIADSASSLGNTVTDLADKAGEALGNAAEDAGEYLENAGDAVSDLWNGLWGN